MEGKKCTLVDASSPESASFVWPYIRHYILAANERAKELDEFHILGKILAGRMHLFVVVTEDDFIGACTVEVQKYPVRTIAQIVHLGAKDFALAATTFDALMEWAKSQGATSFRIHGRKGWERRLVPFGFKPQYSVLEREI